MKQENKEIEMANNYCINCKHHKILNGYHCCMECGIDRDIITGRLNINSATLCSWARAIKCKGNYFEPKQSMWSKFISLFKHK